MKLQRHSPHQYFLWAPLFFGKKKLTITDEKFQQLNNSRQFLLDYTSFEENLLQMILAAEEFESFLLCAMLNQYLRPKFDYDAIQDMRLKANLRMLGFLNSLTSLRDQFPKFRSLKPQVNIKDVFEGLWNEKRGAVTEFCFTEQLRNYAQHQTQPASTITFGGDWDKQLIILEQRLSVFVNVEDVCANKKIGQKEKALYEKSFGTSADVSLLFRTTLGVIGQITIELRKILRPHLKNAVTSYNNYVRAASKMGSIPDVRVVQTDGGGEVTLFRIVPELVKRAQSLAKTQVMANNQAHFISNRARGHK